jgi:hypothetical protein
MASAAREMPGKMAAKMKAAKRIVQNILFINSPQ